MVSLQWLRDRQPILLSQAYWGYCKNCGKAKDYYQKKYCSRVCATACRISLTPEGNRVCEVCGKKFRTNPAYIKRRKNAGRFCSRVCWRKYVADKPNTDKCGRSKKAPDTMWQRQVRERDNYKCRKCGKYEQYIHTHHVRPRSRFPELKHEIENGISLCNSCHAWVHTHPKEAHEQKFLYVGKYDSNMPNSKKQSGKKANWQILHPCKNCKAQTRQLLCHNCRKLSV